MRISALLLLLIFLAPLPAHGDWINLTGAETASTIAEIFIEDREIKLILEIGKRDEKAFRNLLPEDIYADPETKGIPLAQRRKKFFQDDLKFIFNKGRPLAGRVQVLEKRKRIKRPTRFKSKAAALQSPTVTYAEINYPLPAQPKTLTIQPPLTPEGGAAANIGFILFHKEIPVIDFRFLSVSETLILDWKDPWYSKFLNPVLKRHHQSSLMSFLYVEPYEVRFEILARLKDLEDWVDLGLREKEVLSIEDQKVIVDKVGSFFLKHNPMTIDGKPAKPMLDRVNFVQVSRQGINVLAKPQPIKALSAIVGVIIAYATDGLPQEVSVDWDLFNDKITRVPATMTDPAGPFPYQLQPDDRKLNWKNFLTNYKVPLVEEILVEDSFGKVKIPLITVLAVIGLIVILFLIRKRYLQERPIKALLAIGGVLLVVAIAAYPLLKLSLKNPFPQKRPLSVQEANLILTGLLKNTYRSFDFREESDVYDKLSKSIAGDLISKVYLQNRKSLAVEKAGGAQAKVKDLEVLEVAPTEPFQEGPGIPFKVKWQVNGSVGHWGHVHQRQNQYEAKLNIQPIEKAWKITGLELLDEKRLQDQQMRVSPGI